MANSVCKRLQSGCLQSGCLRARWLKPKLGSSYSSAAHASTSTSTSTSASASHQTRAEQRQSQSQSQTHFGFKNVATEEKEELVRGVFANVADKYDVMNDAMSMGVHRLWKSSFVSGLACTGGLQMLDVAGGTGDIAFRYLDTAYLRSPNSMPHVTVLDINAEMLRVGKARQLKQRFPRDSIAWIDGNAENLPFNDNSFDIYTIAFGIRNVTNIQKAIDEAHRVLKPGGVFACLEFSQVNNPVVSLLYDRFSFDIIPTLGHVIAQDRASYQYLVESIRRFPAKDVFEQMIQKAGFTTSGWQDLTFGVACIHKGIKL